MSGKESTPEVYVQEDSLVVDKDTHPRSILLTQNITRTTITNDKEPQVTEVTPGSEEKEQTPSSSSSGKPSEETKEPKSKRRKKEKSSTPSAPGSAISTLKDGETYALSYDEVNDNKEEISEIRGSGRYFGVNDPDLSQPICSNCHRRGHIRVNCKVVVCHACGKIDDHYETQCPNSMVCSNCGKRGHFKNNCKERIKKNYCSDCDSRYHSIDRCPNIWRSYITIEPKDSKNKAAVTGYPFNFIYCYNCASKGHYGDECKLMRTSKTPNINGSAFTGDNLPGKLKNMYNENLERYEAEEEENDRYGYGSGRSGGSASYYGNTSFFSGSNGSVPSGPSRKRKYESDSGYNSNRGSGGYNRVPPPSHLQPKKSGTLQITPRGPSGPSKTGFLPLNKKSHGSSGGGNYNSKNEIYSYPRGGNNENNSYGNSNSNSSYNNNNKRPAKKGYVDTYKKSGNNSSRGGYNSGNSQRGYNSGGNRHNHNNNRR